MNWKYVEKLKNPNVIDEFEKEYGVILDSDLKNCIIKNNGGTPSKKYFDTEISKERVFGALLSFNKEDYDNIYDAIENVSKEYIPFAVDPFGNYICLLKGSKEIVFLNHELNKIEKVANSFNEFLEKLYE